MSGADARDAGAATRRQEAANRRIDAALEALGDLAGGYRLAPGEAEEGDADLAEDVAGALEAGSAQLRASLARRHAAAGAALMRRLLGPGDGSASAAAVERDERGRMP